MSQPFSHFARYSARLLAIVASACLICATPVSAQEKTAAAPLKSLRGVDVMEAAPEGQGTRFGPDTPVLPRDFVQQPPLVPHTTENYQITKEFNKCLDCHAWARSREMNATKISITHFRSREGTEMTSVSPKHYFCDQCHVPQSDAKPLVGNSFKPGAGLR